MNVAREIFNLNTQFINFNFMPGLWAPDLNFTLEKGKQMQEETLKIMSKLQFPINIATGETSQAIAASLTIFTLYLDLYPELDPLFPILTKAPPFERLFKVEC